MIHGDYHANNVHYANNEAILIDMDTLSVGNPVFEFGSIYLAYRGYGELDHKKVEEFMKTDWDTAGYILDELVDRYFEGKDDKYKEEIMDKAKVVGYTRMLRRTLKRYGDDKATIDHVRNRLIEYVNKVDSLAY